MKGRIIASETGDVFHHAEGISYAMGSDNDLEREISSNGGSHYQLKCYVDPGTGYKLKGLRPHSKRIADATETLMPRYLFRVTHASSAGTNEEGLYRSGTVASGLGKSNFFARNQDNKYIRETLKNHLHHKMTWSPWISFIDSIVPTLARALNFLRKGYKDIKIHIVDTSKFENGALIVHAFAMALGYSVFTGCRSVRAKMILGSLLGEVLVWNELLVEASTVPLGALLDPKPDRLSIPFRGLLDCIPELERKSPSNVPKLSKPDPVSGRKFDIAKRYRAAWELNKRLYGIQLQIEFKKMENQPFVAKKLKQQNRAWARGRTIWFRRCEVEDDRVELDGFRLSKYQTLVYAFKPQFQIPMLVGLLSMQTRKFYEESIVEALQPEFFDQRALEGLWFASTNMPSKLRVAVDTFENLMIKVCQKLCGEQAVRCGGLIGCQRNLIRLDDRAIDTTDVTKGETHLIRIHDDSPYFKHLEEQARLEAIAARYSTRKNEFVDEHELQTRLALLQSILYTDTRKRKYSTFTKDEAVVDFDNKAENRQFKRSKFEEYRSTKTIDAAAQQQQRTPQY